MTRWLLLALALSGCDVVLGLEHVDPVAPKVRGTFRYRTVVNTALLEPMTVEEILPGEGLSLAAFLDDATETPLEYREDGSFSFPIDHAGQLYKIRYTSGTSIQEWQHTAPELAIGVTTAGRRDARPVAQTSVTVSNYVPLAPTQPLQITSTGVYTQSSTAMVGPSVTFDWRLAAPASGSIAGMLDANKNDHIYAYELETATAGSSPPYSRIRGLSQAAISQAQGTAATLPQLAPVAQNLCMRVRSNGAAEKTRITNTHPRMYTRETGNWLSYSAPAPDWVGLGGAIYSAICGFIGPRDLDIAPVMHDPYPGTTLIAATATSMNFLVQLPGTGTSAELGNATRVYKVAERGAPPACTPVVAQLDATIGLPGAFLLDGETLNFDNEEIPLDLARSPVLSWDVLAAGPIDFTSVVLYELQAINNVTTLVFRWSATTVGTSAQVEPSMLEVGHTYLFAAVPQLGRPNAATGDMMTVQFPVENATLYTYTFVVR